MGYVNPQVDLVFKKLFGVEENKDLLISLINAVVSEEDQVKDITLLNPYNPQNFRDDKLSVLDIKAEGETGKKFNIEIQISDEADYDKRALYYWAKLYTEQLKSGRDYSTLTKAIGIHILNFISIPEVKKYHNVFNLREKESNLIYFKDIELHTIELKKFIDEAGTHLPDLIARVKTKIDLWCAFLTRYEILNKDNLSESLDDPHLKKALGVLDVMNLSHQEREEYESHLKWLRIEANAIKKAKSDGKVKGKAEEKAELIRRMHARNMPIEEISQIAEMSIAEVKSIVNS